MQKVICFYHSADLDGHCSGAIVARAHPEADLRGINYGQPFPWGEVPADALVFVVDFCLQPFADMLRLYELLRSGGGRLVWIDHHKSAIDAYVSTLQETDTDMAIEGRRDLKQAGCELAWAYIFPDEPMPRAVHLIGRHDVWDHRWPGVEPFQFGLRLYETRPERSAALWARLLAPDADSRTLVEEAIEVGEKLMAYQRKQDEIYARSCAFRALLEDSAMRVLACNRANANSKLLDSIWPAHRGECDATALFAWRRDRWEVHLYTDKRSVDVSEIAVAYGGGGHKGAAGFQCARLPFVAEGAGAVPQ